MARLLVIAPSFLPNIGGVEKHLAETLPIIQRHNYEVTVLVRFHENIPEFQDCNGIKVYRLPKDGIKSIRLKLWLKKNRQIWSNADIVHSHDYYIPYLKKQLRCRWVHTFHGFESYPVREEAKLSRQQVNGAVDYSFGVGKFIEKWYGTPCNEIIWGASSMKLQKSPPKKPKFTYVFLGRLEPDTGINAYLGAFIELAKTDEGKRLVIVGDGSLNSDIEQTIKSQGMDAQVVLQGATQNPQEAFGQAKVALVSGYLAIIEAGRSCMPVVSVYDNPLKKDYLEMHPAAESLYIAGDRAALIDAFKQAEADRGKRAAQLQKWSKEQTWENLANRYIASYSSD